MLNLLNQLLLVNGGDELDTCLKANAHLGAGEAYDACHEKRRALLKERMLRELLGVAGLAVGALVVVAIATGSL
jgi:hypothetical protein